MSNLDCVILVYFSNNFNNKECRGQNVIIINYFTVFEFFWKLFTY